MASTWKSSTLGEALTLQRGFDLPQKKRTPGDYGVISSAGLSGYHNEYKVLPPGIVIGRYGTIGKVFYVEEPFWPLNTTLWVKDFKGNHPKFLSYLLETIDYFRFSDKAAVPGVNRNHVHTAGIALPPLPEQQAIAHILGTLDDKIDLNRRMNETLEAMARALFKSWFIDFDGVTEFHDSELGPIPKGWRVGSFDETVQLIGGGTPKTKKAEYWSGDIPWYSVVDAPLESDIFLINTEKKITEKGLNSSSTKLLRPGTTIISARGTVGKLALAAIETAMNQSCYAVVGRQDGSDFYTYFSLKRAVDDLRKNVHGAVFDTITRQTFKHIRIPLPPEHDVVKYEREVTSYMERIRFNAFQSSVLAEFRDTLLPKLISGELRVFGAEKNLKEVA